MFSGIFSFYLPSFLNVSHFLNLFIILSFKFSSVQSLSHVRLFATTWITACQASLSITSFRSSLRLTSIKSVMPSSQVDVMKSENENRSFVSDSLWPHGFPWNSPGQNTGVGSRSLLQGIYPTQGSNPGLPNCMWILYQLSHKRSPRILEWVD